MRFFRPIDSKAGISGTAAGALEIFPAVFLLSAVVKKRKVLDFIQGLRNLVVRVQTVRVHIGRFVLQNEVCVAAFLAY